MSEKFTAETLIQDAMDSDPRVANLLSELGWKCFDCVAAEVETFRLGAFYHRKDLDELLRALNQLGKSE